MTLQHQHDTVTHIGSISCRCPLRSAVVPGTTALALWCCGCLGCSWIFVCIQPHVCFCKDKFLGCGGVGLSQCFVVTIWSVRDIHLPNTLIPHDMGQADRGLWFLFAATVFFLCGSFLPCNHKRVSDLNISLQCGMYPTLRHTFFGCSLCSHLCADRRCLFRRRRHRRLFRCRCNGDVCSFRFVLVGPLC